LTYTVIPRVAAAVMHVDSRTLRSLLRAFALGKDDLDRLVERLSSTDDIATRVARLDPATRAFLFTWLGRAESVTDTRDKRVKALVDAGLAFHIPIDEESRALVVPLEVHAVLLDRASASVSPLVSFLAAREEDELDELARTHGVDRSGEGDPLALALTIAPALHDTERLTSLFESLQATARNILYWACEIDGPIDRDLLNERYVAFAQRFGESGNASERVLVRLGLLQPIPGSPGPEYIVPRDLREALFPIMDAVLADRCFEAYETLRSEALPAMRHLFPRGVDGDPLQTFRARLLETLDGNALDDAVHQLLLASRIYDAEADDLGELASLHLDVGGAEPFARQILRTWLYRDDDTVTRRWVQALGGDPDAFAELARLTDAQTAAAAESSDEATPATEHPAGGRAHDANTDLLIAWELWLYCLRGGFLMLLSVLPNGAWFSFDHLLTWVIHHTRRISWHAWPLPIMGEHLSPDALPMRSVDLPAQPHDELRSALAAIFDDLLVPVGAAMRDASGTRFMVNSEALLVFRDEDYGFDHLYALGEGALGDDIDHWIPMPCDAGPRINGLAELRWENATTLRVEQGCHLHDLVRVLQFATPTRAYGGFRFEFSADSVANAEEWDASYDEFLLWLAVRTRGPIPHSIRALFPISTAPTDDDNVNLVRHAESYVARLLDQMETWGAQTPLGIIEELRSWGPVGAARIRSLIEEAVERRDWSDPSITHTILLCGEIGDESACPALLRSMAYADEAEVQATCAMACARIGESALAALSALFNNDAVDPDRRVTASGALATLAVMHPHLADTVVATLGQAIDHADLDPDIATLVAIHVAETGHPDAEGILFRVQERGLWVDEFVTFDEAVWVMGIAPVLWGPPHVAAPLATLFPTSDESARAGKRAGLDDVVHITDVDDVNIRALLGGDRKRRRRRMTDA